MSNVQKRLVRSKTADAKDTWNEADRAPKRGSSETLTGLSCLECRVNDDKRGLRNYKLSINDGDTRSSLNRLVSGSSDGSVSIPDNKLVRAKDTFNLPRDILRATSSVSGATSSLPSEEQESMGTKSGSNSPERASLSPVLPRACPSRRVYPSD